MQHTLLKRPDREDLIPGVEAGVRLLKSGFMTSSPLLLTEALRGVSNDEREVVEERGLSIILILAAWENKPKPGSHVKYLKFNM